ncbi:MAG: hypothetical protein ACREIC_09355, partial [Limisphaerales bacterium]
MQRNLLSINSEFQWARTSFNRLYQLVLAAVLVGLTLSCSAAAKAAESQLTTPQAEPNRLELSYRLDMERPSTHLLEVEITVKQVTGPVLRFAMPAWAPGRYAVYDFAKNVQEFAAAGANGQTLPWTQPDKQTWAVDT